ncbi:MAG: hypothetical protein H6974_11090 [Gammaproteobacteria bacterium]|nr:hypothetical protein [Gammaproteobacteria bacterium]
MPAPTRDIDFQVAYLAAQPFWRLAQRDIEHHRPPGSIVETHYEDLIDARCIEMELHTYGCLDAPL